MESARKAVATLARTYRVNVLSEDLFFPGSESRNKEKHCNCDPTHLQFWQDHLDIAVPDKTVLSINIVDSTSITSDFGLIDGILSRLLSVLLISFDWRFLIVVEM